MRYVLFEEAFIVVRFPEEMAKIALIGSLMGPLIARWPEEIRDARLTEKKVV